MADSPLKVLVVSDGGPGDLTGEGDGARGKDTCPRHFPAKTTDSNRTHPLGERGARGDKFRHPEVGQNKREDYNETTHF